MARWPLRASPNPNSDVCDCSPIFYCFLTCNVAKLDQMTSKCPPVLGICDSMTKSGLTEQISKQRGCNCQKHKGCQAAPSVLAQPKAGGSPIQVTRRKSESLGHVGTERKLSTSEGIPVPHNPTSGSAALATLLVRGLVGLGFTSQGPF